MKKTAIYSILMMAMALMPSTVQARLVLYNGAIVAFEDETLTFHYNAVLESGTTVFRMDDKSTNWPDLPAWNDVRGSVTKVVFTEEFCANYQPTSTADWFTNFWKLTTIEGLENLDTSNVKDMSAMFGDCNALTQLDVSHFNTAKVLYMGSMFSGCYVLSTLDVSQFDTDQVLDMSYMFSGCKALTKLDVSQFSTRRVRNMKGMFSDCRAVSQLDVSHFETKMVENMESMFHGCEALTRIDVSHFDTHKVTDMSWMFAGCNKLESLVLTNFDTRNVTDMAFMFAYSSKLKTIDLSKFTIGRCTSTMDMFGQCPSLTTIYAEGDWGVSTQVSEYNGSGMFKGCTSLVGGKGSKYDSSHTNLTYARVDGGSGSPGYFTSKSTTAFDLQAELDAIVKRGKSKTYDPETIVIPAGYVVDKWIHVDYNCHAELIGGPLVVSAVAGEHFPITVGNGASLTLTGMEVNMQDNPMTINSGIFGILGEMTVHESVVFSHIPQNSIYSDAALFYVFNKGSLSLYSGDIETDKLAIVGGNGFVFLLNVYFKSNASPIVYCETVSMGSGEVDGSSRSAEGNTIIKAENVNLVEKPVIHARHGVLVDARVLTVYPQDDMLGEKVFNTKDNRILVHEQATIKGGVFLPLMVLDAQAVIYAMDAVKSQWEIEYLFTPAARGAVVVAGSSQLVSEPFVLTPADAKKIVVTGLPEGVEAYYDESDHTVKLTGPTIGISQASDDGICIAACDGGVSVSCDKVVDNVSIYNMDGSLIARKTNVCGHVNLPVDGSGIKLIRIGDKTYKVFLRH